MTGKNGTVTSFSSTAFKLKRANCYPCGEQCANNANYAKQTVNNQRYNHCETVGRGPKRYTECQKISTRTDHRVKIFLKQINVISEYTVASLDLLNTVHEHSATCVPPEQAKNMVLCTWPSIFLSQLGIVLS